MHAMEHPYSPRALARVDAREAWESYVDRQIADRPNTIETSGRRILRPASATREN